MRQHKQHQQLSTLWSPQSHHHDRIAIYFFNTLTTDLLEQQKQLVRPLGPTNSPMLFSRQQHVMSSSSQGCRTNSYHHQACLPWVRHQKHWNQQQMRTIVFSDKSRYHISIADGKSGVWRNGEWYADACVIERDLRTGISIMVSGGMSLSQNVGPVVFQNIGPNRSHRVTAVRYIDQVLIPITHFVFDVLYWCDVTFAIQYIYSHLTSDNFSGFFLLFFCNQFICYASNKFIFNLWQWVVIVTCCMFLFNQHGHPSNFDIHTCRTCWLAVLVASVKNMYQEK